MPTSGGGDGNIYLDIVTGDSGDYEQIHKFGRNDAVGTTPAPVSVGGIYQTPTTATTLELISTSANDTLAGTGARVVTVTGLDASFNQISEDVNMNGATATTATSNSFLRVYKVAVKTSGTYATSAAPSHSGSITVRASGAGITYATIDSTVFPRSSSQIAAYTVPNGKTVYIKNITISTSAPTNIMIFERNGANTIAAPFEPMKLLQEYDEFDGIEYLFTDSPLGPFNSMTDFGFMAYTSAGTAKVSVDFNIIQTL